MVVNIAPPCSRAVRLLSQIVEGGMKDFLAWALAGGEPRDPWCRAWERRTGRGEGGRGPGRWARHRPDQGAPPPAPGSRELGGMLPGTMITSGAGMHQLYPCPSSPASVPCPGSAASTSGPWASASRPPWPPAGPPRAPVVAVLGDGDFMMTLQDLETAVRENIGVKVLVINDGMYRVLNFRQRTMFEGRTIGTAHGNPDFARLATSFGARARLEKPEDAGAGGDARGGRPGGGGRHHRPGRHTAPQLEANLRMAAG